LNKSIHAAFLTLLIGIGIISAVVIGLRGGDYYLAADKERAFHADYELLKPTGLWGHGFGIVGTLMIILGVVLYSTRKRVRRFSGVGSVKYFLEFHIFLCLTGPILVLYHTTFKFGGLVAVSFWSMTAVVLSGLIGRYFYGQIPKGIKGNELSIADLNAENQKLAEILQKEYGVRSDILQRIDAIAKPPKDIPSMTLTEVIQFFILNDLTRRSKLRAVFSMLETGRHSRSLVRHLNHLAERRITLVRRIAFLEQFRQIFHYWHVIHLPFSVVMFVILFIHVGVAIAFGYTWIF
jgi:hypothetical protein